MLSYLSFLEACLKFSVISVDNHVWNILCIGLEAVLRLVAGFQACSLP